MEKTGEIKPGVTPVEDGVKAASEDQLEDHLTKRTADAAQDKLASQSPPAGCGRNCGCRRKSEDT